MSHAYTHKWLNNSDKLGTLKQIKLLVQPNKKHSVEIINNFCNIMLPSWSVIVSIVTLVNLIIPPFIDVSAGTSALKVCFKYVYIIPA